MKSVQNYVQLMKDACLSCASSRIFKSVGRKKNDLTLLVEMLKIIDEVLVAIRENE